jgi:hypothetical protein
MDWFRCRKAVPLPYEIWELIIKQLLEDLAHPYRQCTWLTFPDYDDKIKSYAAVDITTWKNCRLVCRTFAELMKAGFQITIFSEDCLIPEGVRILHLRIPANPSVAVRRLASSYSAYRNVATLTLDLGMRNNQSHSVDELMKKSELFPELRSLTFLGAPPHDFWQNLARAFPILIALYVRGYARCTTPATFPALEILHIKYIEAETRLFCPRLKHLFVEYSLRWGRGTFIQKHAGNLESYISKQELSYLHRPDIRSQFINLRIFGQALSRGPYKPSTGSQSVPYPSHVYLYRPSQIHFKSQAAVKYITTWPDVRYIFMDAGAISPEEAAPLVKMCWKRGGRFSWIPAGAHPTFTSSLVDLVEYYITDQGLRGIIAIGRFFQGMGRRGIYLLGSFFSYVVKRRFLDA